MYTFQIESTLYSCLNVKELLAQSRRKICRLSGCNWTRTHNHLVHKQTRNHLAKLVSLAKWLSVRLWTKWLWAQVQFQSLKALALRKILKLLKRNFVGLYETIDDGLITIAIFLSLHDSSKRKAVQIVFSDRYCRHLLKRCCWTKLYSFAKPLYL